jgi:hypothetical protein
MAFNHFVKFLLEHEAKFKPISGNAFGWWFLGMIIAMMIIPTNLVLGGLLVVASFLVILVPQVIAKRNAFKAVQPVPVDLQETWELVRWMAIRRELNRRTHPVLRELLEDIASIRRTTLDALAADAWKARAKTPEGAQAIRDIQAVLRDSLYDSIFIGRHLFRAKGQRETTFAKRCADPEFGRHSLASIGQIRDEMRLLSESALAAGDKSDLRVHLVKERLQTLVDAEREVEEFSHFDSTD